MGARSWRVAVVAALGAAPVACTAAFPLSGLSGGDATGDAASTEGSAGESSGGGSGGGDGAHDTASGADGSEANAGGDGTGGGDDSSSGGADAPVGPPDAPAETAPETGPPEAGGPTYAQTVLADSPLAYWRLDEPAGATTALDSSGNGVNGTYVGTFTHAVAGALVNDPDTAAGFDGATAFVDVGAVFPFAGTVPCSLEAWANPVVDVDYHGLISRNDEATGPTYGWLMYIEPSSAPFYDYSRHQSPTVRVIAQSSYTATTGVWAHVVATFDGTSLLLYVNGNLETSVPNTVSLPTATSHLVLGAENGGLSSWWHGTLDEIAVYDHVLTQARVTEHYKVGMGLGP
jgi:hypothetical protein